MVGAIVGATVVGGYVGTGVVVRAVTALVVGAFVGGGAVTSAIVVDASVDVGSVGVVAGIVVDVDALAVVRVVVDSPAPGATD